MNQVKEAPAAEIKVIIVKKPYAKPNLETQGNYTVLVAGAGSF
jgi:hypothetical protein